MFPRVTCIICHISEKAAQTECLHATHSFLREIAFYGGHSILAALPMPIARRRTRDTHYPGLALGRATCDWFVRLVEAGTALVFCLKPRALKITSFKLVPEE